MNPVVAQCVNLVPTVSGKIAPRHLIVQSMNPAVADRVNMVPTVSTKIAPINLIV